MSGNTQLFTNIFDLGPPASSAKSNFQLPLQHPPVQENVAIVVGQGIVASIAKQRVTGKYHNLRLLSKQFVVPS